MAKAKPTKHTAAELKQKEKDALQNKGGGGAGQKDRAGGEAGHSRWACGVCQMASPSIKSLQQHFESKHPKMTFNEAEHAIDKHAGGGGTTQGIAVRGGIKKHHN